MVVAIKDEEKSIVTVKISCLCSLVIQYIPIFKQKPSPPLGTAWSSKPCTVEMTFISGLRLILQRGSVLSNLRVSKKKKKNRFGCIKFISRSWTSLMIARFKQTVAAPLAFQLHPFLPLASRVSYGQLNQDFVHMLFNPIC